MGARNVIAPVSVIIYMLLAHAYMYVLTTTNLPFSDYDWDLREVRLLISSANVYLSLVVLYLLYMFIKKGLDTHAVNSMVVAIVCIISSNSITLLTNLIIINNPYPLMGLFNMATLITLFILYSNDSNTGD